MVYPPHVKETKTSYNTKASKKEKHNRRGSSGFGHKTYGSIKVISGYSHSGFGQKTCGSVKVLSGYSQPGLGQKTSGSAMVMSGYSQSGSGRKTYGSVKAFSGYSHPKVHAAPNDYHTEQRNILPLTFHHLSLRNQAQDCSEGNNCNVHKPTVLASPPLEMRESRARPASGRDSGNQLRNHPCPKSKRTYQIGLDKKKCRSLAALLRRRTQRAIKKANHRKTYRFIRTQALGLARQVPMYWAQDPANGLAHYHNNIQNIGYHRNDPTVFFPDSDIVSEASSYQKDVLQDPHIQAFRIATLNCRGLASISNRERIIHTMQKHNIDILCIQESKVNSNSREVHDGYEMFFSSSIKDDDRNKAYDLKRSGTASRDNPEHGRIFRSSIEHLGVGIIFSKKVKPHVLDIQQHSARNLVLTLKSQTGPLDIISTYVPQACHKDKAAAGPLR